MINQEKTLITESKKITFYSQKKDISILFFYINSAFSTSSLIPLFTITVQTDK